MSTSDRVESQEADLPVEQTEVLICDDEPQVGSLLTDLLQDEGYRTTTVRRGWDAIGCLSDRDIHIAIVDKNLPDISGLEVIRLGLQANPDTVFLIVTAYSSLDSAIEAMDIGASAYVSKPFDIPAFLERIDLARKRASRNRLIHRTLVDSREAAPAPQDPARAADAPGARASAPAPARVREAILALGRTKDALLKNSIGSKEASEALEKAIDELESALAETLPGATQRSPVVALEKEVVHKGT